MTILRYEAKVKCMNCGFKGKIKLEYGKIIEAQCCEKCGCKRLYPIEVY